LAFGATHAPHQAPEEYLDRHRGKYDEGWDVARERWFAKQIGEGLVPPDTELAPRNPGVEEWDSLPENQKRLALALQEAFGAFLEHTDAQIGRLVDAIDALGQLDNTVIVVLSDNGASQEGGPFGVLHEMKFFNFLIETPDQAVDRIPEIGGPDSHANYPWGWAQAGNTPFKWYKQNTHEGGVHVPFIVHWPAGITDRGAIRNQFHYVTDVAPTIYELIGVQAPEVYRGVEQFPIAGESMAYAFTDPTGASTHNLQYFEMFGHRAMYAEGWKAVTRHTPGVSFDDDIWELYNLTSDPSECNDLAEQEPERLAQMIEQWWVEAETYGVLPLDDRGVELFGARFGEHSPHRPDRRYTYRPPMAPLPTQSAASLGGRSWTLTATVDRNAGQGGVLYAMGNGNSGLSAFVQNDRLIFDYNCFGDHFEVVSDCEVPEGRSEIGVRFERTGKGGSATVVIDGADCGSVEIPFVMRVISSMGASVGFDHGLPVSRRYSDAFAFEGTLHRVDIELAPSRSSEASAEAAASARSGMSRQ
jgi:arylsulfatase